MRIWPRWRSSMGSNFAPPTGILAASMACAGSIRSSDRFNLGVGLTAALFQVEGLFKPGDHVGFVVLLVGFFPASHAVTSGFDGDDIADRAYFAHGVAHQGRLLVGYLVVTGAVDGEEGRHALVQGVDGREF